MKKTYTKMKVFAVTLSMAAITASAQLGGVYTINSGAATGGSNFQSFNDLKTALVNQGVASGVTVNVVANSGPYNEQVDFPQIAGTSLASPVIINGNGNVLTFGSSNTSQPWTLGISGGDFFTFNDLIVNGTGSSALTCHIWNDSDNNTFNNCEFTTPQNTSTTAHIPYSLSGSATTYASSGDCGDNNVANGCTMRGGYFGVTMYGMSGSPYNLNNQIINCNVFDWYFYGIYNVYQRQALIRGNRVERPNRTLLTTGYGIYGSTGFIGCTIEKNRISNFFATSPGFGGTAMGIYLTVSALTASPNIIQNNLIDLKGNSNNTTYGIYSPGYQWNNYFHNTIVVDGQDGGNQTVYGAYIYGLNNQFKNNNISITRNGTGNRYGLYFASTMSAGSSNGNNVWVSNPTSTNYYGYYNVGGNQLTLATWSTATGFDANSFETDPFFISPATGDYMPASYVMNNGGQVLGLVDDILNSSRSATNPDPGAWEYFNTACAGSVPVATAITPTTIVCPNTGVNMYLSPSYTTSGNTYQWQVSNVSSVGPWTAITTGTNPSLTNTVGTVPLWYSAIVTCTNGNNNVTSNSGSVNVAATTTNNVYYFEGFEGIGSQGKLPNCSWSASDLNGTCLTYTNVQNNNRSARTGNSYASFLYNPGGSRFFWTNGIWMEAGVTYSINTWYKTEYYTYPTWQLQLWVSPSQSTVNANVVATTGGPGSAADPSYKLLNNTYTVATSGFYYVGINGTSNGLCCANYLSWDDLEISVPCNLNQSPVAISVTGSQTVCAGSQVNLNASGADSYLWNNGSTSSSITVNPVFPTNYVVVGTNALTGCTTAVSQMIYVNPAPVVGIFAPNTGVCPGDAVSLTAFGASSYAWNTGATTNVLNVSPTAATSYTVIGTNSYGCTSQAVQAISIFPVPTAFIGSSDSDDIACIGDVVTLNDNGTGGVTFQWISSQGVLVGNPVNVSPQATTLYTLVVTNAQGCKAEDDYELSVVECVGLNENTASVNGIKVFPNPNNGVFNIEWNNGLAKTATVTDISGKVVYTAGSQSNVMNVDLGNLSNGVYFVKVESNGVAEVIRVVKH